MVTPASSEADVSDHIPRRYQEEVFRRAQKGNIIAALNTGAGKTLISLLLVKWIAAQEKSNGKIIVFLVPKVTLVKQQADYLDKRTPESFLVQKLHGALDLDLSDRAGWKKRFESNHLFVMTAQILLNILTHSLWSINKISLMIFDECHHARKNHPYNGILREYFQVTSERPKIFGMTASPIWNIKDPLGSLTKLEENMDAKVIGVREHVNELEQNSPKPEEIIKEYPYPPESYEYPFPTIYHCFRVIDQAIWDQLDIPWSLIDIRYLVTLNNVGPYGASLFLYLEIQHHVATILAESKQEDNNRLLDPEEMDVDIPVPTPSRQLPEDISLIIDILLEFQSFFPPDMTTPVIPIPVILDWCSPKVRVLVDILLECHSASSTFQGIIFVEQRQVASSLSKIIQAIPDLKGKIRSGFLVGQGVNSEGVSKQTDRINGDPVKLFREKTINILIATSVAEEGLDFQACDLVVRFDPLHHMIGYVQSRGRARNKKSTFILMCQQGDVVQLERYQALKDKEPEVTEMYQNRHIDFDGDDEDDVDDETYAADLAERERYVVPTTGAVLTYDNCLSLLNHLCSLIPRDAFTAVHKPKYTGDYEVTLSLPRALPLPSPADLVYTGPRKGSKKEARRAVAFMAVRRLQELEVFDEYLLPVSNESEGDEDYHVVSYPGAKVKSRKIPPIMTVSVRDPWCIGQKLWLHPVILDGQAIAGLITGTMLPPAQVMAGTSNVHILPAELLHFDKDLEHEQRAAMNEFTRLGIWYNITSSPFTSTLSLYLVPITPSNLPDFDAMKCLLANPRGSSDWSQVCEDDYDKLMFCSQYRFGSMHLLRRIRHDLSPVSTPLPGSREAECSTYHEYWVKKWSKKNRMAVVPTHGPLLETLLLPRSSMGAYPLQPSSEDSIPTHTARDGRLLPQNCSVWIAISYTMRRAFEVLPALCQRVTNVYRARCVRYELNLPAIPTNLLIEVFTIPSASLSFNNQRLETLGDAVLQICTTVHLLNLYPNRHEGQLTKLRQKVVSNRYLLQRALDLGVEHFINSEISSVHKWRYMLPGKGPSYFDESTPVRYTARQYPRRSLQDCMEAMLGAGFLTGGISMALHTGTALGLEFGGPLPWCMRYRQEAEMTPISPLFAVLESRLGYKFRHNNLVLEALTHPSFGITADGPSYQRLEFLGDAILDLVVIKYLYDKFPNATSHQMAFPRTKAICSPTLANLAVRRLGLHKMMLVNNMELSLAMDRYVPVLERISGEEIVKSGWKFDPPKALSDVFESVIGAVLVDSGYDYEKTAAVTEYIMEDVLDALSPALAKDPVSELTEWVASAGCRLQVKFEKMLKKDERWGEEREGIAVLVHGKVVVGPIVSSSLTVAKFIAAERAQAALRDAQSDNSLEHLCNCAVAMQVDEQSPSNSPFVVSADTPNSDDEDAEEVAALLIANDDEDDFVRRCGWSMTMDRLC